MSIEAIQWALDAQAPMTQKHVLLILANYADERGECWPSVENMAEKCGASKRTVINAVSKLIDGGFLTASSQFRRDGRRTSNRYTLNFNVHQVQNSTKCNFDQVQNLHPTKCNPCTLPSAESAPLLRDTKEKTQKKKDTKDARPRKRLKPTDPFPAIPESLQTPEFKERWQMWLDFRANRKKKPVSPEAARLIFDDLEPVGPARACELINHSIKNDWQGIFVKDMATFQPADDDEEDDYEGRMIREGNAEWARLEAERDAKFKADWEARKLANGNA
jgi:hypothetical protein